MPRLRKRPISSIFYTGLATIAAMMAGCGVESGPSPAGGEPSSGGPAAGVPSDSAEVGAIQHADDSNFADLVLRAQGPVLVDFYADWCGPCKVQAPILEDFARQTPEVSVVKVDVDQAPGLAQQYEIRAIPSLRVFREGRIVAEHAGVAEMGELRSLVGI